MTDFYTFTVEKKKTKKRKQPPTVCIRFFGCKNMDDANKLAEHLNIMLNTDMIAIEGESLH